MKIIMYPCCDVVLIIATALRYKKKDATRWKIAYGYRIQNRVV